jgi:hypothetical protein
LFLKERQKELGSMKLDGNNRGEGGRELWKLNVGEIEAKTSLVRHIPEQ